MSNDPELFKSKKKKSNRNSKKKEYLDMLDDFNLDKNNDNYDKSVSTYNKNFKYLSTKEKDIFENKFSFPKNESQKRFLKYLHEIVRLKLPLLSCIYSIIIINIESGMLDNDICQ